MLHNKLSEYLAEIAESIRSIGLGSHHIEKYEEEILSDNRVNLRIRIRFLSGHLPELNEALVIEEDKLHHLSYRYHFQEKNNRLIFRFDNAPHFPDIETFPHHKHLPNQVEPSEKPSISEVINEVQNYDNGGKLD